MNVCSLVCVGRRSSGCKHYSLRLFLHGIGAQFSVMSGRRDAMIQTNYLHFLKEIPALARQQKNRVKSRLG